MSYLNDEKELLKYLSKREKLEYVLELGGSHERLPKEDQTKENLVPGCQSRAWLVTKENKIHLDADSVIVRGYLHFVQKAVNETNTVSEAEKQLKRFLKETDLEETMTPTRSNAIPTVIEVLKKKE